MKNIFLERKINKELKEFEKFKQNYVFQMKELREEENGALICGDIVLRENKEASALSETETLIDVGYKNSGAMPKLLSNLFPYEFNFCGKKLSSIESFFQGIKFKDKKSQNLAFNYWGLSSNHIKAASDFDWKETQTVYFQGRPISRVSKEYELLVDKLYISLLQNPLYRNALRKVKDKYILHSIGKTDTSETVFTRYEFEFMLNCLKSFVAYKDSLANK